MLRQLNGVFHDYIPFFILVNFLVLCAVCGINAVYIKSCLARISKKTWIILASIFILALAMRIFIPPKEHIMYIDEAWYMEAAKNMLYTGLQGPYPKPIGWPFVLAVVFSFFGVSNLVAIYTSVFFGALTTVSMFLMTFVITRRKDFALMSAFFISFFPAHIRWSASAETNVVALFFITLTVFFCFLYYRTPQRSLLWLVVAALAFTCQFRPENYMLPFLFAAGCIIFDSSFLRKFNFMSFLPWLTLLLFVSADCIQVFHDFAAFNWVESFTRGRVRGSNLSLMNLCYNSFYLSRYFINGYFQPVILSFFIVIGAIWMFIRQKKEWFFLVLWFCSLYFVYFSYCFIILGAIGIIHKGRFFMMFYPVTLIFVCYGIDWVQSLFKSLRGKRMALCVLLVILTVSFVPYSLQASSWYADSAQLLETKIPELIKKDLPADCVIVANWPTILRSTTNFTVIDINDFLENKELQTAVFNSKKCILFFEDIMCNFEGWDLERCQCENIKSHFLMEPFLSYRERKTKFSFFKIISPCEGNKVYDFVE